MSLEHRTEPLSPPAPSEQPLSNDAPSLLYYALVGVGLPVLLAYMMTVTDPIERAAVVVLALIGVASIMSRPFWGLLFFIGLTFIRPEENYQALQGLRLPLLTTTITLIALSLKLLGNQEKIVRTPTNLMLAGFMSMVILSCIPVGMWYVSLAVQHAIILISLVVFTINLVQTPGQYRTVVTTLLLFIAYLTVYSIYLNFSGQAVMVEHGVERAVGTGLFDNPNELAASIIPGLAIALARSLNARKMARFPYIVLSALMVWAILLTQSRGGMIALVAVCTLGVLSQIKSKPLAFMVIALMCPLIFGAGSGRMTNFDSKEASANSRFVFWDRGMDLMKEHPVLGIGYRRFGEYNDGMDAHNAFVKVITETGLPGFFFYMGIIYYCFRKPSREEVLSKASPGLVSDLWGTRVALVGYLVAAFWGNRAYNSIIFLLFSLPIAGVIAADGTKEPYRTSGREVRKDWMRIALLCWAMIELIQWMIRKYI